MKDNNSTSSLWEKIITAKDPLSKFRDGDGISACIYPKPYEGKSDVVRWIYCCATRNQVFFACSQDVSDRIDADSWAEVSDDFTEFVEHNLMNYCEENTDWEKCSRYGIDYSETFKDTDGWDCSGCDGTMCPCKPFDGGNGWTNGIAGEGEFTF